MMACVRFLLLVIIQLYPCFCESVISNSLFFPDDSNSSLYEFLVNHSKLDYVSITFTDNVTLSAPVKFENITDLAIMGESIDQNYVLTCCNESGLSFIKVLNLTLANLKFEECGMIVNSTSSNISSNPPNYSTWKVKTALYITLSMDITMSWVEVSNSSGVGILLTNSGGKIYMSNCTLKNNRIGYRELETYPGGGGLHIELTTCEETSCRSSHINESAIELVYCIFESNNASVPRFEKTGYVRDGTVQYYGRGGGLFIVAAGNVSNYFIAARHCTFNSNTALWGGAIAVYVLDRAIGNIIVFFNCMLEENSSPLFGGGGALIKYSTSHNSTLQQTFISFQKCLFLRNVATFGGGMQFVGGISGFYGKTVIEFTECVFLENRANSSAAVDITKIKQGFVMAGLSINFTKCRFVSNWVIDSHTPIHNNTALQVESGTGAFTVLYLNVTFLETVLFENNTGTALYVIAGFVNFEQGIRAKFIGNKGYNGGAMTLMASSLMIVQPNSSLYFIRNTAARLGGAIFAFSIGLHQLHKLTCFIHYCDDCHDSVNFYFVGNMAGVGNNGNAIFSDNLPACQMICNHVNSKLDSGIFSCFGNLFFCDSIESSNNFLPNNCSSPLAGQIRGLADQFETFNDVPISVYSGRDFNISLDVYDQIGNIFAKSYYVAEIEKGSSAYIEQEYRYIGDKHIRISGNSSTNATLILHRVGFYDFQLKLNVSIVACPPGFVLNSKTHCSCDDEQGNEWYRGIMCSNGKARVAHGKWVGYIGESNPANMFTSLCPIGFCLYNTTHFSSTYEIPSKLSEFDRFVCEYLREGRVCGECSQGASVYFHSPQFKCKVDTNCKYGWLFYFLSELIPITIVYVVVMILNISFTSGYANGFIFFAQVISSLAINANGINGLNPTKNWIAYFDDAYHLIYNSFNLDFFAIESLSFCLWRGAGTLDIVIIKYVSIVYAFLLVMATVLILNKCRLCCKCASFKNRTKNQSHVIHGLSAFLISCYVQCMSVSFLILTPTHLEGLGNRFSRYSIVFYSGHLDYLTGWHLLYAVPAFLCVVVVVITPPFLLLIYPLFLKLFSQCGLAESKAVKCLSIPFEKIKPLLDSFQSCYKDNFRFVAGLFFVYRALILLSFAVSVGYGQFYVAVGIQLVVMSALHFIMQPHRNSFHNTIDMLIFSNLLAINSLSLYRFGVSYQHDSASKSYIEVAGIMQLFLIYLPLMVVVLCLFAKFVFACRRRILQKLHVHESSLPDYFLDDFERSSYSYRPIRLASFN